MMTPLAASPTPEDFLVISSITMKKIGFNGLTIKVDRVIPVANVWGRCDRLIRSQRNAKGKTFPGCQGSFHAESLQTKGLFRSDRAFFPSGLGSAWLKTIELNCFAIQLSVIPVQNAAGYCWISSLQVL